MEFSSWLPTFYDDFLAILDTELKWAASHLPEQYPAVVLRLLTALFTRTGKGFRSRMEASLASGESLPRQIFQICNDSTLYLIHTAFKNRQRFMHSLHNTSQVHGPSVIVKHK